MVNNKGSRIYYNEFLNNILISVKPVPTCLWSPSNRCFTQIMSGHGFPLVFLKESFAQSIHIILVVIPVVEPQRKSNSPSIIPTFSQIIFSVKPLLHSPSNNLLYVAILRQTVDSPSNRSWLPGLISVCSVVQVFSITYTMPRDMSVCNVVTRTYMNSNMMSVKYHWLHVYPSLVTWLC